MNVPLRDGRGSRFPAAVWLLLLVLLVFAAFSPALDNGFVEYDDDTLITENPNVARGIDAAAVRWAFTESYLANWHPLTWLSIAADVSVHGMNPRGHHLTGLLLHLANALLLLLVLRAYTGDGVASALAAMLFALHPLRVEAVAWAAERKELLAFFFGMLALAAYRRHAARPGPGAMALVAAGLGCGLMAKPVLVTFPFALLLLDWWPLGRFQRSTATLRARMIALVLEKIPLFALAAAGSVVAFRAQSGHGATGMLDIDFGVRAANAVVSYARYLGKTLWPVRLSFFYPHPERLWPVWSVAGSLLVLAALAALGWRLRRGRPWVGFGLLWFAGTLVPMIGLVQVGWQALADRYTYLPHVGLAVVVAWEALRVARIPRRRALVVLIALVVLGGFAARTHDQTGLWRDSRTLFGHAIALDSENWLARQNLGGLLVDEGEPKAALPHLELASRLRPGHADAWYNLGCARHALSDWRGAIAAYERAIGIDPRDADYHANLGAAYLSIGRLRESIDSSARALALDSSHPTARQNHDTVQGMLRSLGRRTPER